MSSIGKVKLVTLGHFNCLKCVCIDGSSLILNAVVLATQQHRLWDGI